jgi:hypothetical protein
MLPPKRFSQWQRANTLISVATAAAAQLPEAPGDRVLVPLQRLCYHCWKLQLLAIDEAGEEVFTRCCEHVERFASRVLDAARQERRPAA